jgi:hypothetical protein
VNKPPKREDTFESEVEAGDESVSEDLSVSGVAGVLNNPAKREFAVESVEEVSVVVAGEKEGAGLETEG